MRKTQLVSGLVAFAVTPVVLVAMGTPASAMAAISVTTSCGYSQTCEGYAQDVPNVGTGADVTVSCTVYTPFSVQATTVQCYILGNTGDVHYTPTKLTQGQASTTNYTFDSSSLTSRSYNICVGGGYFSNGGTNFAPTNFRCGSAV